MDAEAFAQVYVNIVAGVVEYVFLLACRSQCKLKSMKHIRNGSVVVFILVFSF